MAAHGVAGDGLAGGVEGVVGGKKGGELFGDVAFHLVVVFPWLLGGGEVEAGRQGRGRRGFQGRRGFVRREGWCRGRLGRCRVRRRGVGAAGFDDEVFVGAGEAGEPVEEGDFFFFGLGGEVEGEGHFATGDFGGVAKTELPAVKGFGAGDFFDGGGGHVSRG